MARRSAKLLRFENTLYKYNNDSQEWVIDAIDLNQTDKQVDFSDKGTYATCKHMSQKVNPISLRKGFLNTWDSISYINYKESIEDAIKSISLCNNDIILITGSLYLAGEVLNLN